MAHGSRLTARSPWLLAPILVLGAVLRLWSLSSRGLVYWDEGKFALEGLRLKTAIDGLLGSHGAITGKAIGTAKPTHALLIAMAYAIVGVHDYAPLILNAIAGTLEIAVLYVIARRLFDPIVGIIAALLLAVSEYDVIYSRSALSESDGTLVLLLGILLWLGRSQPATPIPQSAHPRDPRPSWPGWVTDPTRILGAGLLLGLAFTINYRLIVYIAVIVGFDLAWSLLHSEPRLALQRGAMWAAGLMFSPALWQIIDLITRAAGFILFRDELNGQSRWYLQEVVYQLHEGKQSALQLDPLIYLQWLQVRQGWLFCLVLLLGVVIALVRRSFPWLALATLILVPYVVYAFAPFVVPRNLEAAIPFAGALTAAGLVTISRELLTRRLALPAVMIVSLVLGDIGAAMSWRLTSERSGYAQAAAYVQAHGNGRALVSSEIMAFYLRGPSGCLAPELRSDIYALAAGIRDGYRYAILDHFSWKLSRLVRDRMSLVAGFQPDGSLDIGEDLLYDEHSPRNEKTRIRSVAVFRLDASRLPPPGRASPYSCSYDRV